MGGIRAAGASQIDYCTDRQGGTPHYTKSYQVGSIVSAYVSAQTQQFFLHKICAKLNVSIAVAVPKETLHDSCEARGFKR